MSPRLVSLATALLLVCGACGGTDQEVAQSTTSTSTSLPIIPSTTEKRTTSSSTSTTASETALPSYLIYGWEGVARVHRGISEVLTTEPVRWATEDGAGGVVFRSVTEEPGWVWLPGIDAEKPVNIDLGDRGSPTIRLVFTVDDRASALVSRTVCDFTGPCDYGYSEDELEISLLDLASGDETFFRYIGFSQHGGEWLTSYGEQFFTTVGWTDHGASRTQTVLRFYDINGNRVWVEHNPFEKSCAPCHLEAMLSPDGSMLAYTLWPTAYWDQPRPQDGDYPQAIRDWYEENQRIPTEVVVMDLATGVEVFGTEAAADTRLTGFDGRFVTVTGRTIFDIQTGEAFDVPPAMTEPAGFWTVILASLDNTKVSYDEAQVVAGEYEVGFDVETGVLWSDGFITLNPGYWAVFAGHFSTRAEAVAQCEVIDTACYARYVATVDTIDREVGRSMLTLEGEGLGLISFGDPEHEAVGLLTRLLGEPSRDSIVREPIIDHLYAPNKIAACNTATGYACFDYIRHLSWDEVGLRLTLADLNINESATAGGGDYYLQTSPNLRAYSYGGGEGVLQLATPEGITVGSTLAELRKAYGDRVTTGWDECANKAFYQVHEAPTESSSHPASTEQGLIWGFFSGELAPVDPDDPISPAARIGSVNAGARSSC